ncbi:MAG: hypothetical protein IT289_11615, partial [Oligoflexia bacterium]|nr:hypothetical protein [Oligoflexia bacterium]
NSEIHNYKPGGNGTAVGVGGSNIVIFRNQIHDNGNVSSTSENDVHGIGGDANNVWVLENHTYRNSGDSVQFGHNDRNVYKSIYIGKNEMHHDRENAVDIKEVSDVVVSQNKIYGYRATSSSEGAAVVVHYCPINSFIIFNEIFDSQVGISSTSLNSNCTSSVTVGFIGNVIYGIFGNAIQSWGSGKKTLVVGNTLFNVNSSGMDFTNLGAGSKIENNLLWRISGSPLTFSGAQPNFAGNLLDTIDPRFMNENDSDFRLQPTSPAIDAGVLSTVYSEYELIFGVDVFFDYLGIDRARGRISDIGAYEFQN